MVYQSNAAESDGPGKSKLKNAIRTMPRWKWKVLGVGLVIGLIGIAGEAAIVLRGGSVTPASTTTVVKTTPAHTSNPPSGASGFIGGGDTSGGASSPQTTVATTTQLPPTLVQSLTPFMTHIGFSLFIGVIVGLLFRTFLRWAVIVTGLIVAAAWALSYFHIMNVDLTLVKNETSQATSWISDQGYRFKDMLFNALPSSSGAAVGFIFGFKKR